ncbi:MAG: hypothetical protein M9932_10570 [Xanthobacteraceae bacterium]|nr:hypothetical protein [Xanthobacteraceae bacterium]
MAGQPIARGRNVIDLSAWRPRADPAAARPLRAGRNFCAHCGAWMAEGESEDECSARDAAPAFRAVAVQ